MDSFSQWILFLTNVEHYKECIPVDREEFKRQVSIYDGVIAQIRFVWGGFVDGKMIQSRIDLPDNFFGRHYQALVDASAYIKAVDRKLRDFRFLEEEFVWGDGEYNEICSHSMICDILGDFGILSIYEADQLESLEYAFQKRNSRIDHIFRAMNIHKHNFVSAQYFAEVREHNVHQALEILNYNRPSQTFASLAGLTGLITLSDNRLIELASEIAKAESDKKELESWRDHDLDSSEEDADYLADEMGEEPTVSTKKVSKGRRPCKKVKCYP